MASVVGGPTAAPVTSPVGAVARGPRRGGNPWRRAWGLEGFTWLYIAWSILPIAIAVLFSFNKGASQATWQGFSLKWYVGGSVQSVLHNRPLHEAVLQTLRLAGLTTLITVPIGWRSRSGSIGGTAAARPA